MPDSPSQRYRAGVACGRWQLEAAQLDALLELDRIAAAFADPPAGQGWWTRLRRHRSRPAAVPGLYLWGGVGRGKTLLCDLLLEACAERQPLRMHFHRFMQDVHARMKAQSDTADTLRAVAAHYAARSPLLVLDEFFVADIADAMILGRLLELLFAADVTLVTTSNLAPEQLYADGLQRARFLPAIELLQRHCVVHHLQSAIDFRLRQLTAADTWIVATGAAAEAGLAERYRALNGIGRSLQGPLQVNGRSLPARALGEGVAWFDFAALCDGPRAVADYIEIAREYHTVLIGGIPGFDDDALDPARRFVHLIDELYDRNVNLLATAATAPERIYRGKRMQVEFDRCRSRLVEMRSAEYLARPHRA